MCLPGDFWQIFNNRGSEAVSEEPIALVHDWSNICTARKDSQHAGNKHRALRLRQTNTYTLGTDVTRRSPLASGTIRWRSFVGRRAAANACAVDDKPCRRPRSVRVSNQPTQLTRYLTNMPHYQQGRAHHPGTDPPLLFFCILCPFYLPAPF